MKFRTEISIPKSEIRINYQSKIFSIGSCFADVIGEKLKSNKFHILSNPFGTVYNPVSISKLISTSIDFLPLDEDQFVEHHEQWYHYDYHSELTATTREELKAKLKESHILAEKTLRKADVIIVTFGTAFVYKLLPQLKTVSNCHKQQRDLFTKEFLTIESIVKAFHELHEKFSKLNSKARWILTVSPVRHVKDTLELNSVSKSILRVACELIKKQNARVEYFPSYEIMIDDLRDYRFYKDDLIHPTSFAEDFIWEKFKDTYFETSACQLMKRWEELKRNLEHRPFNPESTSHKRFLQETLNRILELREFLEVEEEIKILRSRLEK